MFNNALFCTLPTPHQKFSSKYLHEQDENNRQFFAVAMNHPAYVRYRCTLSANDEKIPPCKCSELKISPNKIKVSISECTSSSNLFIWGNFSCAAMRVL